jgi:hypothetical protein
MRSPVAADILTGTRSDRSRAVPARRGPHDPRDPWLRIGPDGGMTLPLPGQPGHGRTASLRRQPVRIVGGRMEGGYTGAFELICPGCGDHPYLDYSEIPAAAAAAPRAIPAGGGPRRVRGAHRAGSRAGRGQPGTVRCRGCGGGNHSLTCEPLTISAPKALCPAMRERGTISEQAEVHGSLYRFRARGDPQLLVNRPQVSFYRVA